MFNSVVFLVTPKEHLMPFTEEQQREYRLKYPDRWRERQNKSYLKHREERLKQSREYYQANKDKIKARTLARYHKDKEKVKAERLAEALVPLGEKCEECGSTEDLERHHPDYSKALEVRTLCRKCHNRKLRRELH